MSRSRLLFPNNHRSGSVFHSGRIRCPFSPLRSRKLSSQILNPSQNLKEIPCRICAKGKATQEKHVHLAERILSSGLTTSLGMAVAAKEAHADVMDTIKAGTNLVQKDTVIGIAFGTAILALGAVTIGVSHRQADMRSVLQNSVLDCCKAPAMMQRGSL